MPAGRKPKLNWTKFLGQYTTTIEGKFHRLGTDKADGGGLRNAVSLGRDVALDAGWVRCGERGIA